MILDVVVGVFSVRYIVKRQVRDFGKRLVERFARCLFLCLQLRQRFLQRGDLSQELARALLVFFLFRFADFLRRGVAAGLGGFELEDFLRRSSSRAISRCASGAKPRRDRPRSNASGCSRMKRMSCM